MIQIVYFLFEDGYTEAMQNVDLFAFFYFHRLFFSLLTLGGDLVRFVLSYFLSFRLLLSR